MSIELRRVKFMITELMRVKFMTVKLRRVKLIDTYQSTIGATGRPTQNKGKRFEHFLAKQTPI